MRHAYVPHFRVQHAVNDAVVHDSAAADAGTHGQVKSIRQALRRAPAMFA
jgi:hypothetical protein